MRLNPRMIAAMADPAFAAAYEEWKKSPVTERVFALLREAVSDNRLPSAKAEDALSYAGMVDGEQEMLSWLCNMATKSRDVLESHKVAGNALESTYGVQKPVKKER